MKLWKALSVSLGLAEEQPHGPAGKRAYAIGDVHGRLDLLDEMLGLIARDRADAPAGRDVIVLLGDLIDRGPQSAEVIERVRTLVPRTGADVVCLLGNHEEYMLRALDGEDGVLDDWLRFGGDSCVSSYGLRPMTLAASDPVRAAALLRGAVPATHLAFLQGCADRFEFGDYLFVHAGIRPGVPLDQQVSGDLRWIREPFLSDRQRHARVIVHGHSVSDEVENFSNRIGLDTGAYRTGRLSALVVEGAERRFLQTG